MKPVKPESDVASSGKTTDPLPVMERRLMPPRVHSGMPPRFKSEIEREEWEYDMRSREEKRHSAWAEHPPGTTLRVTTARGLKQRRRAGIDFGQQPKTITVIEHVADSDEYKARRAGGEDVVDPEGAADIANDDALLVLGSGDDRKLAGDLRAQLEEAKAENNRLRAELQKRGALDGGTTPPPKTLAAEDGTRVPVTRAGEPSKSETTKDMKNEK